MRSGWFSLPLNCATELGRKELSNILFSLYDFEIKTLGDSGLGV